MLRGRDDFLDFTEFSDYDIVTVDKGYIIKLCGYISVPEEFDMTQIIEKFKPMLQDHIYSDITNESEKKAYDIFLETSVSKIPIFIDMADLLMCSKLMSNNMLITYEELEEYEELEVTIVIRVISTNLIDIKKLFMIH